jgi:hypothetical protein
MRFADFLRVIPAAGGMTRVFLFGVLDSRAGGNPVHYRLDHRKRAGELIERVKRHSRAGGNPETQFDRYRMRSSCIQGRKSWSDNSTFIY